MFSKLPEIISLLVPISQEHPVGENLEYEPLFEEIRLARECDPDYLPQDEWSVSEPRKADWALVRTLSERALIGQSKDLQLACWFVEALCHQNNLAGLEVGVTFLSEFIMRFWFQCWPSLEDEGIGLRRSKLQRLDRDLNQRLLNQPLLRESQTSLACWRRILAFEHKLNSQPENRNALISQEGDLTMATFEQQAVQFSAPDIDQQLNTARQLKVAFEQLEAHYLYMSKDPEGEVFTLTLHTLVDLTSYLQRLSKLANPQTTQTIENKAGGEMRDVPLIVENIMPLAPQPMNRELAIAQMLAIAGYFRQTEPSSPIPFLMERAARWANIDLTEWLKEMLTNSSSIEEINNVLIGRPQ